MSRLSALPFLLLALLPLGGCSESYSPNTYAAGAAQQAAKVDRGVIVGVRPVLINANGTVGAVTGGAAGGVTGAQAPGGPLGMAFGAIGGTLIGGLAGSAAEQAVADAKGWEYIVQEPNGHLVSVAQTDKVALPIGLHVLVIAGKQARIVPDYTVRVPGTKPAGKPAPDLAAAPIYVTPLAPVGGAAASASAAGAAIGGAPPASGVVPPAPAASTPAGSASAGSASAGSASAGSASARSTPAPVTAPPSPATPSAPAGLASPAS